MKLVVCNLAAQVAFMAYSEMAILTPPAASDTASPAIVTLFTVTPRITAAAIISAIGGYVCVALFSFLKQRYPKGAVALAVRNSISSIIGNWINTALFFVIAFYGVFETKFSMRSFSPPSSPRPLLASSTLHSCSSPAGLETKAWKNLPQRKSTPRSNYVST